LSIKLKNSLAKSVSILLKYRAFRKKFLEFSFSFMYCCKKSLCGVAGVFSAVVGFGANNLDITS